jgi:hypothetical protein
VVFRVSEHETRKHHDIQLHDEKTEEDRHDKVAKEAVEAKMTARVTAASVAVLVCWHDWPWATKNVDFGRLQENIPPVTFGEMNDVVA